MAYGLYVSTTYGRIHKSEYARVHARASARSERAATDHRVTVWTSIARDRGSLGVFASERVRQLDSGSSEPPHIEGRCGGTRRRGRRASGKVRNRLAAAALCRMPGCGGGTLH